MGAFAIKTMEIVSAKIDRPTPGATSAMCGAGKRQARDPAGACRLSTSGKRESGGGSTFGRDERGEDLRKVPIIRVIFAKQKQKAPESVRTSGIALRRLWALASYNRAAGLWFQPTKSNSGAGRKQRPRPIRAGPTGHRTSMSTPGRDLLISTPG